MKFETGDNHYNRCYYFNRPVGRGFDARSRHSIFHWLNPSGRTVSLGSTRGWRRPVLRADNLTMPIV